MSYEDFTTYTEFDEGNDVTVDSATKVSWVDLLTRIHTAYLYKDKGVNHFSGDFVHKFEIFFSAVGSTQMPVHWMLANSVGDLGDIIAANEDAHTLFVYTDTENIYLRIFENGSIADDDKWAPPGPQASTLYFIEVVRDDDGGANSTGRLTAYIRTGSHTGVLQDTLVADCSAGEQNDFRYLYAVATNETGGLALTADGFTQNLDIGEVAAGWTGKINGVTNPAKIMGVAVANISKVIGVS